MLSGTQSNQDARKRVEALAFSSISANVHDWYGVEVEVQGKIAVGKIRLALFFSYSRRMHVRSNGARP